MPLREHRCIEKWLVDINTQLNLVAGRNAEHWLLSMALFYVNVRENRSGNHEWTVQRNCQHWVQDTGQTKQITQHRKINRLATRIPLKTGGEPMCSWRISHSCLLIHPPFYSNMCKISFPQLLLSNSLLEVVDDSTLQGNILRTYRLYSNINFFFINSWLCPFNFSFICIYNSIVLYTTMFVSLRIFYLGKLIYAICSRHAI